MFLLDTYSDVVEKVGGIANTVFAIIKWVVPVLLVIMGGIDLGKAVVAGKDDEIKKAQGLLLKRIVAGVLVFLLVTIINLVISLVTGNTDNNINEDDFTSQAIVEIV